MKQHKEHSNLLQFENLKNYGSLLHFSTTIQGGVSSGNYSSFNLGMFSGDIIENITANRKLLMQMLGIDEENLLLPYQTHGNEVSIIDEQFMSKSDIEKISALNGIDAIVTNQKGVCIGVGTADCVPILILDPVKNVFAAIHAGWRGTVSKIVSNTIDKMTNRFNSQPQNMIAGIGPCISFNHFEVGNEVIEIFKDTGFDLDSITKKEHKTNKIFIDLKKANMKLLIKAGLTQSNIEIAEYCTFEHNHLFFSARRQTINSGRMITGGFLT